MSSNAGTVIALKTSFLRTQTRILSQPLQPTQKWLERNEEAGELSESAVKDVMREVNRLLRRHNKSVYSSLSIRHVAEQIEKLYWNAGVPDLSSYDGEDNDAMLRQGDDLYLDENISKLPDEWDVDDEHSLDPAGEESYTRQLDRLRALSARRAALRKKLATYEHLQTLLEPFKNPMQSVQPNLVTRDAELADELARCRALGIRVGGRVAGLAERKDNEGLVVRNDEGNVDEEVQNMVGIGSKEKLEKLLEAW